MPKKFLCGVANLFYYDGSENLVFQSRTMIDTALEVSISNENIKSGQGNAQQFIYFHSPELSLTATESQFNLEMLASSVGSSITTGTQVWTDETVTLGVAGVGTVTKTPVTTNGGATIYGWYTDANGVTTRVEFTGSNFSPAGGTQGDVGCIRYYNTDNAARSLTVNGNFIPSVGKVVLDAQLFSGDSVTSSSLIGKILVEIPTATMMGTASLSLTSGGVSNTPINFMALASQLPGCTNSGVYAYIKEQIFDSQWYDNVFALAMADDTLALTAGTSPLTVDVYAVPYTGSAFKPPYSDITWATDNAGVFTVVDGVLTFVGAGTATLTFTITGKPAVSGQATITAS